MYFKIFLPSSHGPGRAPLLKYGDDHKLWDLKLRLAQITQVPVDKLNAYFKGNLLGDDFLLSTVSRELSKTGFTLESDRRDSDIKVYFGDKMMCSLRCFAELACGPPQICISHGFDLAEQTNSRDECQDKFFATLKGSGSFSTCALRSSGGLNDSLPSTHGSSFMVNDSELDNSDQSSCNDPCEVKCCDEIRDSEPPYSIVLPEDRRFGVIIVNDNDPGDCNFDCLMKFLVQQFENCEYADSLKFSECTPAVGFDCSLMIVSHDLDTQNWTLQAMSTMCPPYRCSTFIKHFQLVRCSFVLPMVVKESLCRIFSVFECQNSGLSTSKWCVVSKNKLSSCSPDYASKVVYNDITNMEITVYIDKESKEYVNQHCNQIKYMLWHLIFDCCHLDECIKE